jgi:uncharacterized protein (DUF427 family)
VGDECPPFAHEPAPGQESVWDYPRPPRLVSDSREVVVSLGDVEIIRTRHAYRMLETASPPTFYLPFSEARRDCLVEDRDGRTSHCEWKGSARYLSIAAGDELLPRVGWWYPTPVSPYEAIAQCFSVYPGRVACFVDGERVRAQEGGFYGGWVTNEIAGPWKGTSGTSGW